MRPPIETVGFGPIITRVIQDGVITYEDFSDGNSKGIYSWKRVNTGSITANYRALRKKKQPLPFNDYSCFAYSDGGTRLDQDITTYDWHGTSLPLTYGEISNNHLSCSNTAGYYTSVSNFDYGHIAAATSIAEQRLRSKIGGLTVNLAQSLAERKQTANLIANSSKRAFEALYAIKKGNLQAVKELLHIKAPKVYNRFGRQLPESQIRKTDVGDMWLEYKYGWKPLMQDIYGSIDLLNKKMNLPSGLKVSASAKAYQDDTSPSGNHPKWSMHRNTRTKLTFIVQMEDELKALAATSGISNPALLAWELIPYSFVFDWFMPVGTYLEGLTAYDGYRLSSGSLSQVTNGRYFADYAFYGTSGNLGYSWAQVHSMHGLRTQWGYRYDRSSISMPPLETPTWRNPIGGDALDRFATAASLVRQFLPSEKKGGSIKRVR